MWRCWKRVLQFWRWNKSKNTGLQKLIITLTEWNDWPTKRMKFSNDRSPVVSQEELSAEEGKGLGRGFSVQESRLRLAPGCTGPRGQPQCAHRHGMTSAWEAKAQVGGVAISMQSSSNCLSPSSLSGGTSLGIGAHMLLKVLVIFSFASRRWNTGYKTMTGNCLSG